MVKKTLMMIVVLLAGFSVDFAQESAAVDPVTPATETVCLTQAEAKEVYVLAAKGKGYDLFVAKAEAYLRERDKIIEDLKVKLAVATQDAINLSNQAVQDNAVLDQYRQYFFTKGRVKCIGVCVQIKN
jgi:hypothetical protein